MNDPKEKWVGLRRKMKNGMYAEIIEYVNHKDISVRFEDGTVVYHKRCDHFTNGTIKHPAKVNPHIGETVTHGNTVYTIITWRRNDDIDFVDDTGFVYEHKSYYRFKNNQSFKKRNIKDVNYHIGERKQMNCGEYATVIDYDTVSKRITIKFDDGTIKTGMQYSNFTTCRIGKKNHNKNDRTGETSIMSNGQTATIIAYRSTKDIDVQFEDGYKKLHTFYTSFKKGHIYNPNKPSCNFFVQDFKSKKEKFLHQKTVANCGLECQLPRP